MCYAHAIHLVVCDVLYKKRVYLTESANEFEADDIHECEEETNEFEELREDLSQTLDMVAGDITESDGNVSCSNMFRGEFWSNLVPILDTKNHWNCLLAMLETFLEIQSSISKALIDIGEQRNLESEELNTLAEIVLRLKPVKMGLEKLCSRISNLLTAE